MKSDRNAGLFAVFSNEMVLSKQQTPLMKSQQGLNNKAGYKLNLAEISDLKLFQKNMSTFSNAPGKEKKKKTSWTARHGIWVRETGRWPP